MPSLKQLAANRANAKKSTGPRTPEGKAKSRQNAINHGFYSKLNGIPGEDLAELDLIRAEFLAHHQPTSPDQHSLVGTLVQCEWERRRYERLSCKVWREAEMRTEIRANNGELQHIDDVEAATWLDNSRVLSLIQQRLDATIRKQCRVMAELRILRAELVAEEADASPEESPQPAAPKPLNCNLASFPNFPESPLPPAPDPLSDLESTDYTPPIAA